jgi:hypothetical protein
VAGFVIRVITLDQIAVKIYLDQIARGDFVKQKAIGVDQVLVRVTRHSRTQVREDRIGPAIVNERAVAGSQLDSQLPLCFIET